MDDPHGFLDILGLRQEYLGPHPLAALPLVAPIAEVAHPVLQPEPPLLLHVLPHENRDQLPHHMAELCWLYLPRGYHPFDLPLAEAGYQVCTVAHLN